MAIVTIQHPLTTEEIANIAITAVEQGIGYWARARGYDGDAFFRVSAGEYSPQQAYEDETVLFEVAELDDQGYYSLEGPWHPVTPAVIARGIGLILAGVKSPDGNPWQFEPRALADMDDFGAMDSDEADWAIQLGLFGRLVYG